MLQKKNVRQADFFCPFCLIPIKENNSCHFQKKNVANAV